MELWKTNSFETLLCEAERCVAQYRSRQPRLSDDHVVRVFTRLMLCGRVCEAVRFVTDRARGGVLKPSDTDANSGKCVLDVLREKHPPPGVSPRDAFVSCTDLPLLVDVDVTSSHVEQVAGPGGADSYHWQCFLLNYGAHSSRLREAVADLAMHLANDIIDWTDIRALMANRLIALDKCPGVRLISIGDYLHCVLGHVFVLVTGLEAQSACGVEQLACGMQSGIVGAFHAMSALCDDHSNDGWGFLLLDVANAFNSVNRAATLWNARVLWPSCSCFLFNTYRGYVFLLLKSSNEMLLSREGVTQEDPLSMLFYSVATLPLVRALKGNGRWFHSWYADDLVCAGSLDDIRCWLNFCWNWALLMGTSLSLIKVTLYLVVAPNITHLESDAGLGISVVCSHSFLGSVISKATQCEDLIQLEVTGWIHSINALAKAARKSPQAAFAAMAKFLQFEWSHVQKVVRSCGPMLQQLHDAIVTNFFPALFDSDVSDMETSMFFLCIHDSIG